MKKIIFLLLLLPFFAFGQSKGKSVKESFLVDGNCNMCKNRIETATLKLNGVKYVNWDSKSSNFSIIYNSKKVTIDEIRKKNYNAIIISPGPGTPEDKKYFGVCKDVIMELGSTTPILGVCLGHQGIIACFGGKVVNAGNVRHGKTSLIKHYGDSLFNGVKNPFRATRYHSLVGDKTIIPDSLKITAVAEDDGEIMGVSHKKYLIEGVQFHPESIMTDEGKKILKNFIMRVKND